MTLKWVFDLTPNNYTHGNLLDLDKRLTVVEQRAQQRLLQPGKYRAPYLMRQHLQSHRMLEKMKRES
jgi:hypothetical protein